MEAIMNSKKAMTITEILRKKNVEKITMLTAYDAMFARMFDGEVDMILVGDSLNMSFYGASDTLSTTLEQMIYHTKAVCNGAQISLVVCDLPFGSAVAPQIALESALRVFKETRAHAVKLEGGAEITPIVRCLVQNGIAVMGHIGLKPQLVRLEGGYKIKGEQEMQALLADAKALENAGVFCIVLEGVRAEVAKKIACSVCVPVVGIGSGVDVDGQVLVWSDMFGFFEQFKPKFVRKYLEGSTLLKGALKQFVEDVKSSKFPSLDESY